MSPSFKDNAGRDWPVAITIALARDVSRRTGINLGAADLMAELRKVCDDRVKLVDVLFVLCERQAKKLGFSEEDFGAAVWGAQVDDAENAFVEALLVFTPSPRAKDRVGRLLRAVRQNFPQMEEAADRVVDNVVANLDGHRRPTSGDSSSSTPG